MLDTSARQAITNDIEAFCRAYPEVPVLVTSREVGYEEAPLDKEMFNKVYYLASFDAPQINEYAQKWFASDADRTDHESILASFLNEIEDISIELKSSPLLLALLCSLYWGEGSIPRSKVGIYEKCSDLLFERRDKERGIKPDIAFETLLRPTVRHLAYWIYQDTALQNGVTERNLITQATAYLLKRRFEDRDEAEHAAKTFIQYCLGRAWVFTDTGTTKDGEPIFQFTHRTFLEYFAAEYLAHAHNTVTDLLGNLLSRIMHNEWNEVAQLAFQKMSDSHDGVYDELLVALLKHSKENAEQENDNILSFALFALEFAEPKPSIVRELITTSVERCIALALEEIKDAIETQELEINDVYTSKFFASRDQFISHFIFAGAGAALDNRKLIGTILEEILDKYILVDDGYTALIAAEIGLNLDNIGWRPQENTSSLAVRRFFKGFAQRIFDTCSEHIIKNLCPKYVRVALDVYQMGHISLQELIHLHKPQVVFQEHHNLIYSFFYDTEFVIDLLADFCDKNRTPQDETEDIMLLQELADALLPLPTPWVTEIDEDHFSWVSQCQREIPHLDSRALFGVFIGLAYIYERVNEGYTSEQFEDFLPHYFQPIVAARNYGIYGDEDEQRVELALEKCGFSEAQKEFVWEWIGGPIIVNAWHG